MSVAPGGFPPCRSVQIDQRAIRPGPCPTSVTARGNSLDVIFLIARSDESLDIEDQYEGGASTGAGLSDPGGFSVRFLSIQDCSNAFWPAPKSRIPIQ